MKTEKFNNMISAFACDFALARDDKSESLSQLDEQLKKEDYKLLRDIELLEELDFMLRRGQAEIVMKE